MATAEKALNISLPSQATLAHLTSLLHLFHHRNKNQHRHSIWWRHFSLFRKNLSHLTTTIDQLNALPTTNLARTQKKRSDALLIANHEKRLVFWRDVMVPRWQRAFSQVVADGRFAVLGVVLMAVLAEVCAVVGVTVELEELGQGEVERVLEEFGREEWGEGGVTREEGEDRGEVVRRVEDDESEKVEMRGSIASKPSEVIQDAPKFSRKRCSEAPEKKTKRKRKKTGNAIDDIFG